MNSAGGAHLTHDELSTPQEMASDCAALTQRLPGLRRAARAVTTTPPSLRFEDYPAEVTKRGELPIDQTAVQLANALHLHLD